MSEFTGKLKNLDAFQWRQIKAVKDFLAPPFELTTAISGSKYATLSTQPLVYESLTSHCEDTLNGTLETGSCRISF